GGGVRDEGRRRLPRRDGVGRGVDAGAATLPQVTTVGLISDTHGLLRPEVPAIFSGVDLILHAGDVGGERILAALQKLAPTDAVYGNVDDASDRSLRAERRVVLDGVSIHVSHGHELGRPTADRVLARYAGHVPAFAPTPTAAL